MRAPARHAPAAYDAYYPDEHYGLGEFSPGERIGPPPSRTGRKILLRGVFLLILLGGGWALLSGQVTWPGWLPADIASLFPSIDRRVPSAVATPSPPINAEPTTRLAALDARPLTPQPPASSKTAATPGAGASSAAPPLTTAALPPATARLDEAPVAPLPPPTADPADPYQMRAAAVGLHPGLSRVLLARLSPADYHNAGIAIKTALAETPGSAAFVWPRQRKPELALFKVRFVPGAAPGCRRYVVTVTKDGWLTTALPMEKCGSEPRRARRE